ncbi:MAG: MFS transporter [Deltaproteobacteria bacterium]|jgi:MFS family permease|nr:MFS transporter [Deltaproteobacteria bacterium]MBW2537445.1 MFS transporter [Deltaproteobacteria bacterium]
MSQFTLLGKRRFGPFFGTQFLGAFNDNLFKNAVVILFAFSGLSAAEADALVNLSAGIFILPFFLFSSTAGQLADKYEKAKLIRIIKLAEIGIMALAAVGFFLRSVELLLAVLFLMGTQSTMFGPVKYSILPAHLRDRELVGGNGLVEMGTFVAILIGTIAGGLLIAVEPHGPAIVSASVISLAVLGWLTSRYIPVAKAPEPNLRLRFNPVSETVALMRCAGENRSVLWSILAISWFWFYGALFLAQFPGYARSFLGGNEQVVTAMLAAFSIGIGVGSTLCERMSRGRIELGLVPLGAIGMTAFAVDLYFASPSTMLPADAPAVMGAAAFFSQAESWRIFADLTLIGVFGGWFIVPLYTLMQHRSRAEHRSRVIAANNVLNAVFMVAAAGMAIALRAAGLTVTELFLVTGALSLLVVIGICTRVPEFPMRFVVWLASRTLARVSGSDLDQGPERGPVVIVSDDAGPIGVLAIAAVWRRPVRFVVPSAAASSGLLGFLLRSGRVIPVEGDGEATLADRAESERELSAALAADEVVCLFSGERDGSTGLASLRSSDAGAQSARVLSTRGAALVKVRVVARTARVHDAGSLGAALVACRGAAVAVESA